nr:hypothetical protein [Cressdnaviricota sp.]
MVIKRKRVYYPLSRATPPMSRSERYSRYRRKSRKTYGSIGNIALALSSKRRRTTSKRNLQRKRVTYRRS